MVVRWAALAGAAAVLWLAQRALPPFVIAGMLAYILSPLIDRLAERTRAPRAAVVVVLYVVLVGLAALAVHLVGPPLLYEARALGAAGPSITGRVVETLTGGRTFELGGTR